jgi:hypothetical protein
MNERLSEILKSPVTTHALIGAASFASGFGACYIWKRRTEVEVIQFPHQPELDWGALRDIDPGENIELIETDRPVVIDIKKDMTAEDIQDAVDEAVPDVETDPEVEDFIAKRIEQALSGKSEVTVIEETIEHRNIFAGAGEGWDYDTERESRSVEEPYVIHKDEFFDNEKDYTQGQLTFYVGDRIMADSENVIVYDHLKQVGELKFGHGSDDPNVFYVRNDKMKVEWEILNDEGHYAVEVLGMEIEDAAEQQELRHSHSPRRFRAED